MEIALVNIYVTSGKDKMKEQNINIDAVNQVFENIFNELPEHDKFGYIMKPTPSGFDIYKIHSKHIDDYLVIESMKQKMKEKYESTAMVR